MAACSAPWTGAAGPAEPQTWLDNYRLEYNQVRPHEALGMKTPASVWSKSQRRYDPHPPPWVYPEGSWTLKVDCQGTVDLHGRRCRIGKTLAGERVLIQPIKERFLVFYCSTLVREIHLESTNSTIVQHWIQEQNFLNDVKDVPGHNVKNVPGLDKSRCGPPILEKKQG